MLNRAKPRIAVGALLLAIGFVGLAFSFGRTWILYTHRHVTVEIFNVGSTEQVFVNCELAAAVGRRESGAKVNLGWLRPNDRVYLSATSRDGDPSWGFHADSNGQRLFYGERGDAGVLGFPAEPDAVVFAKAFTAARDYLGPIGCQAPGIVSLADYLQSPDDDEVSPVKRIEPAYRQPAGPYDWIDSIGGRSPIVLAILGVLAAVAMPPVRQLAWSHRRLAGGILGLFATIVGVLGSAFLLEALVASGVALLFGVALLLLLPSGKRYLERAAGGCGAEG